jgi:hypothetical protein
VIAHLARVINQVLSARRIVIGLYRIEVRGERCLRIDDHALAAGQADHQVGPEATVLGRVRLLLDEVRVLDHAGELDDLPELHFAPVPAHVRLTQRLDEPSGLALQRRQSHPELLQLFGQRGF